MSNGDSDVEDYLSDKFLLEAAASNSVVPKTYQERRKEAARLARLKNEQNRTKGRRQLEIESRQEGLSKSLFERAKEEQDAGIASENKALSIMMKMGFKPGQSLGKTGEEAPQSSETPGHEVPAAAAAPPPPPLPDKKDRDAPLEHPTLPRLDTSHKTEPLSLNEWMGKKGIGLGKRARSPSSAERVAKMAKMEEVAKQTTFRDRARQEYEERRAEGRLKPAQRTCMTLDEKEGKKFNILWLDPKEPETLPEGLVDALSKHVSNVSFGLSPESQQRLSRRDMETELWRQMHEDALQPLSALDNPESTTDSHAVRPSQYPDEILAEASQFLRLSSKDRLHLVLGYLRDKYAYCFWCGTQYDSLEELEEQCPGPDEESHD